MYLEKLEIQGFKSFANKNKLIFSGFVNKKKRGLTAIVGPNGSGKSNIADAIRWALGEQSLKTLRGKKSEDVIFSGSDRKNQLSRAEVSLYLNNSDILEAKIIPVEKIEKESDLDQLLLSCREIVITRRLYRSGESEYLLNNNRVRLTDIQMLLAKANFGQKTYSVIGQGMVENFLNSSTTERKDFFDEATGVKQFQIKRDTALNKLETSYENLQQVDMLLTEIKPRLRSLTRQVKKLKHRSEIEKTLRTDQLNYYGFLWQSINRKLNDSNKSILVSEKIKLEQEKKLEKLNIELNKIRNNNNLSEINEVGAQLKELNEQKNQHLKRLTHLQAELEFKLESQGKFDISWLHNKQTELRVELEKLKTEIITLNENDPQLGAEQLKLKLDLINSQLAESDKKQNEINELKSKQDEYLRQVSKLEAILEANLEIQEKFDASWFNNEKQKLQTELTKIDQEIKELEINNTSIKKNTLETELNSIQPQLNQLNKDLQLISQDLKKNNTDNNQTTKIKTLIDKFLDQLEQIDQETELNIIKQLLNQAKIDFKTKIKIFIEQNNDNQSQKIRNIQEKIIILTEKRQKINNKLNEEQLRLASINERQHLLIAKKLQTNQAIEAIEIKLKETKTKFKFKDIEEEKIKIIEKINLLQTEIDTLTSNNHLTELNQEKQIIENKIQTLQLKSSSAQERLRLLQIKENQLNQDLRNIEYKIAKSKTKFDETDYHFKEQEINQKLIILTEKIQNLENKLAEFSQQGEAEKNQMFKYQEKIQSLQQDLNSTSAKLNDSQIISTRQETKLEDLELNIKADGLSVSDISQYQLDMESIDSEHLYQTINKNKNQLELIGGIDPEAEQEYEETNKRYNFLSGQTSDLEKAIKSLEQIVYELDKNITGRFDSEFKIIAEKFNEYFKILFIGGNAKIFKLMTGAEEEKEIKNNPIDKLNQAANSSYNLTADKMLGENRMNEKLKNIKFLKKHNAAGLAGIEIQATPPGKKIQAITMLSGGERALTAIALICAIISANPSPFVVLDEVDAALDEANSERLAEILDTLSNKTQFIIITHNRACMQKANILYGVTMESDGVSKLLSVKLADVKITN